MPITWIEWDGFEEDSRSRCHIRIVDFETASRNGEPFSRLNEALGILPNPVMRTCTANLKVKAGRAFMQSRGYGEWQNVMGIRADEPRRVTHLTSPGRDNSGGEPNLPLARANVRKADVLAFWRAQPFDLALDPEGDFGNCDGCFLKAPHKIVRVRYTARAGYLVDQRRITPVRRHISKRPPTQFRTAARGRILREANPACISRARRGRRPHRLHVRRLTHRGHHHDPI
ncbi:hypothetical protein [Burkholderia sp. BDU5]|uniref:hypothetical protein n=1 Tax=Burkholderia sp. BDU5 TaxID=1385590 RepID=UPI000AD7D733|nr:hypothetical protein [Burkholderia sp. BDU5]